MTEKISLLKALTNGDSQIDSYKVSYYRLNKERVGNKEAILLLPLFS